jgi:hypothetical protein
MVSDAEEGGVELQDVAAQVRSNQSFLFLLGLPHHFAGGFSC